MSHQTYICKDMNDYITKKESEDLFTKKMNHKTKQNIINFIHNKVKNYVTYTTEHNTTASMPTINVIEMITIPRTITSADKLRRWLYMYLKMCKYYSSKYSTANTPVMSNIHPVSIYEIILKLFSHQNHHEIYLQTHYAKKEHIQRIYGYTFHTLSLETFHDIVHELSLFVQCDE